jgi:hypothetical protein
MRWYGTRRRGWLCCFFQCFGRAIDSHLHPYLSSGSLDFSRHRRAHWLRDDSGRRFFNWGRGVNRGFLYDRGSSSVAAASQPAADLQRYVVIQRARMCFLVADTKLGQKVQNHVGLDLQLTRQFVNANFAHRVTPCR